MKALITGCNGQVGQELMALSSAYGFDAVGYGRNSLDITNQQSIQQTIQRQQPDVVINAAAYTAVDKAEEDAEVAFSVNAAAVGYLAQACAESNIPLVHISTDYVFDGSKIGAYDEDDPVSPQGVYGESKLAGEILVREICKEYYILRTSWVFSVHGNNFVKTMLRLGVEKDVLGVVADQYGKPTSASEIAKTIYTMLNSQKKAWGTYHIAQLETTSWHGFACSIFEEAKKQGLSLKVSSPKAITTKDYPTPAKRPMNSELNCDKLQKTFCIRPKQWVESLAQVIAAVNTQQDSKL